MSDERTLILGLDLCDETTQLAVYDRELMEPVLMGQSEENPDALIETAVSFESRDPITGFLENVKSGKSVIDGNKKVDPERVLAYFLRKTLSLTRMRYPGEKIKMLVITVPDMDKEYVDRIYESLKLIGLENDRVKIIDHKRSYMYYVLYQKKELWASDVGLFDYDGKHLIYRQLQVDRTHDPALVGVKHKDYTDAFAVDEADADDKKGDFLSDELISIDDETSALAPKGVVFENIVKSALRGQYVSSLFMTGEGFESEWADDVFPRLAVGRRLFRGRNLYVSGAVYAAKEFGDKKRLEDYVVFSPDMVPVSLTMEVYQDGKTVDLELARAGDPWFEVDTEVDLIPDGDTEIVLNSKPVFEGESKKLMLDISPVIGKNNRMTRLGLRVRFEDAKTAIFTIRDKGFGEIMPGTDRVWEETVKCL
ncbi:MAG: hypothetical protein IJ807_03815 [Eubacterium sp.]|nr:hypothetical protein [Eubacterium sp.]